MSKKSLHIKIISVTIIAFFVIASFTPIIVGLSEDSQLIETDTANNDDFKEDAVVTCFTLGYQGEPKQEITMPLNEAELLLNKIRTLEMQIAKDPSSERTQQLQDEIIDLANEYNLLPQGLSPNMLKSRLHPSWIPENYRLSSLPPLQNRASEWFCNFASTGSGSSLPVIIFPRLIPILLTPIPRVFLRWSAIEGTTSCGGLLSGKGFLAYGQQKGFALGFWGLGFSVFLPPLMGYGLIGYALYASVEAEEIEYWPPNNPPVVDAVYPPDGGQNIPVSTSELRFYLEDFDGDLMNYTVTTDPYIGYGSGSLVSDGEYSISISDLEGTEEYTWTVIVNDGEDVVEETYGFMTEPVAPVVYDPIPEDDERYVSVDLTQLSFKLKDYQGDPMDYTVETSPDIGSGSGTGVGDGTYTVDVSGLDYTTEYVWYVNVTDGEYWKHKVFSFQTEPKMVFDPFEEGWQYRKQITIDHNKVDGDLTNFPVLVSTIDTDLRDKAQNDGDDILFMDDSGIATRLYHEIEYYDDSIGELAAWVNVPTLFDEEDTMFYIYYGNQGCACQAFPEQVWDSNYLAVFHMGDTSGTIHDSTANGNDFSQQGNPLYQQVGKIGCGIEGNGDNAYFSNSDMNLKGLSAQTLEAWFQIGNIAEGYASNIFSSKYDTWDDIRFGYRNHESKMGFAVGWDDGTVELGSDYTHNWNLGEWHHAAGTIQNGDKAVLYTDGVQTLIDYTVDFNFNGLDNIHNIGRRTVSKPWHYDGVLDEFRISDISRSAEWVSAQYNNQNNPLDFLSIGPEEPGP